MENQELLEAIKQMIEKTEVTLREEMQEGQKKLEDKIQGLQPDIMNGVTVLLDTEFKRNFNLLWERLDEIKMSPHSGRMSIT